MLPCLSDPSPIPVVVVPSFQQRLLNKQHTKQRYQHRSTQPLFNSLSIHIANAQQHHHDPTRIQHLYHQRLPQPLLHLLTTGLPSPELATLINDRAINKLITTTQSQYHNLINSIQFHLVPTIERIILQLPPHLQPLAALLLNRAIQLESHVLIEQSLFSHFTQWIKFEIDKISLTQGVGPQLEPKADFDPVKVEDYLLNHFAKSRIEVFLDFGSNRVKTRENQEVQRIEEWLDSQLDSDSVKEEKEEVKGEGLGTMMKRLGEELRGQSDRSQVLSGSISRHLLPPLGAPTTNERPDRKIDDVLFSRKGELEIISLPFLSFVLAERVDKLEREKSVTKNLEAEQD